MVNSGLCPFGLIPSLRKTRPISKTPLHPADEQPLQVQFEGDPEVELEVEGVVVPLMNGRARNAPPAIGCMVRVSTSTNPRSASTLRNAAKAHLRPRFTNACKLSGFEEVDIALAGAAFSTSVRPCCHFSGGGRSALAEERGARRRRTVNSPVFDAAEGAVDAEQVAQVEFRGEGPAGLADLILADEDLDLFGPVAELEEVDLPCPRLAT